MRPAPLTGRVPFVRRGRCGPVSPRLARFVQYGTGAQARARTDVHARWRCARKRRGVSPPQPAGEPPVAMRAAPRGGASRGGAISARGGRTRDRAVHRVRRPAPWLCADLLRCLRARLSARVLVQDTVLLPKLPSEARAPVRNPHLHVLAADGAFLPNGRSVVLPRVPASLLAEGFRRAVLDFLVENGALSETARRCTPA
jgi:hypothetical protein